MGSMIRLLRSLWTARGARKRVVAEIARRCGELVELDGFRVDLGALAEAAFAARHDADELGALLAALMAKVPRVVRQLAIHAFEHPLDVDRLGDDHVIASALVESPATRNGVRSTISTLLVDSLDAVTSPNVSPDTNTATSVAADITAPITAITSPNPPTRHRHRVPPILRARAVDREHRSSLPSRPMVMVMDPLRVALARFVQCMEVRLRDVRQRGRTTRVAVGAAGASTLAQRLDCPYSLVDLVVPPTTRAELTLFETAARHGHALFGPDTRGGAMRGLSGFVALFSGRPGTGKTMGAQIVARSLEVDLLRIDLSQVVNKYIGETEKRLDLVFREAEASGALLFFDEADALFGKRTEVKDAHDRYSNIETAFLLQRLEQHPGVAILATNLANNLDSAFLRRLHFVIEFPMPNPEERKVIWERHLRDAALADDLDLGFLARFELSGGDIRNAAIAAVLLGHAEPRITMRHLVLATSRELRKAGRLAQPDQFGRWREDVLAHLRGRAS